MLTVARFKIRKDFKGNVISEEILEEMPEELPAMLKELGAIYAESFCQNRRFHEFCENYRKEAHAHVNQQP